MSILNKILKTFIGDKTKKDLSKITPLIKEINDYQKSFESLSNDELREKTVFFKSKLNKENKIHNEKINKLNNDVKKTDDIDEKESLYKEIDQEIINMQINTDSILSGLLTYKNRLGKLKQPSISNLLVALTFSIVGLITA